MHRISNSVNRDLTNILTNYESKWHLSHSYAKFIRIPEYQFKLVELCRDLYAKLIHSSYWVPNLDSQLQLGRDLHSKFV